MQKGIGVDAHMFSKDVKIWEVSLCILGRELGVPYPYLQVGGDGVILLTSIQEVTTQTYISTWSEIWAHNLRIGTLPLNQLSFSGPGIITIA